MVCKIVTMGKNNLLMPAPTTLVIPQTIVRNITPFSSLKIHTKWNNLYNKCVNGNGNYYKMLYSYSISY